MSLDTYDMIEGYLSKQSHSLLRLHTKTQSMYCLVSKTDQIVEVLVTHHHAILQYTLNHPTPHHYNTTHSTGVLEYCMLI